MCASLSLPPLFLLHISISPYIFLCISIYLCVDAVLVFLSLTLTAEYKHNLSYQRTCAASVRSKSLAVGRNGGSVKTEVQEETNAALRARVAQCVPQEQGQQQQQEAARDDEEGGHLEAHVRAYTAAFWWVMSNPGSFNHLGHPVCLRWWWMTSFLPARRVDCCARRRRTRPSCGSAS